MTTEAYTVSSRALLFYRSICGSRKWITCLLLTVSLVDHSENSRQLNIICSLQHNSTTVFAFSFPFPGTHLLPVQVLGNADLPAFGLDGKMSQRVPFHNWICDLIVHCSIQVISWHLLEGKTHRTHGQKGLAMEESLGTGPRCLLRVLDWACFKWGGGRKVVYIGVIRCHSCLWAVRNSGNYPSLSHASILGAKWHKSSGQLCPRKKKVQRESK